MGYDETDSPRRDRGRNRQPVKRMGDRDIPYRRSKEPGHKEPGLNLITDSFRDQRRREPRAGRGGPGNVQTPGGCAEAGTKRYFAGCAGQRQAQSHGGAVCIIKELSG